MQCLPLTLVYSSTPDKDGQWLRQYPYPSQKRTVGSAHAYYCCRRGDGLEQKMARLLGNFRSTVLSALTSVDFGARVHLQAAAGTL